MKIHFMCLGSGSSGNCYYLAAGENAILIDAGLGPRSIKKILKERGLDINKIRALFITHDHADHIRAVGSLAHYYKMPVYATVAVHDGMNRSYCMTQRIASEQVRYLEKETPILIHDFKITAIEVPHDSSDNVGYLIEAGNSTLLLLTDMGRFTPTITAYIQRANYLIMEMNYDETMLANGPYPAHLKARICNGTGHMSNRIAAQHLAENFPTDLRHLWLCHLSKENNHPELALKTMQLTLHEKGITTLSQIPIEALRRTMPSPLYELDF